MPDKFFSEIVQSRGHKNQLKPDIPYHFLQEQEPGKDKSIKRVNTLFLTGKECAFKCLMCDLWKNTLDFPTPEGALLKQIDFALNQLPQADFIKLYNSSNFFDPRAVPISDYPGIATRLHAYERIIVENHPNLSGNLCVRFSEMIEGKLEVAMGLETIHPQALSRLNKQMIPEDFRRAAFFLKEHRIDIRAFVLLNPPYITDKQENIDWTIKAIEYAFESGVDICSMIPTRPGNGIMEQLQSKGQYVAPEMDAIETVFEKCLNLNRGLIFIDTWDIAKFSHCKICAPLRKERLDTMNLTQRILPEIICSCEQ